MGEFFKFRCNCLYEYLTYNMYFLQYSVVN